MWVLLFWFGFFWCNFALRLEFRTPDPRNHTQGLEQQSGWSWLKHLSCGLRFSQHVIMLLNSSHTNVGIRFYMDNKNVKWRFVNSQELKTMQVSLNSRSGRPSWLSDMRTVERALLKQWGAPHHWGTPAEVSTPTFLPPQRSQDSWVKCSQSGNAHCGLTQHVWGDGMVGDWGHPPQTKRSKS